VKILVLAFASFQNDVLQENNFARLLLMAAATNTGPTPGIGSRLLKNSLNASQDCFVLLGAVWCFLQ
jgi:hypothetical protein